MQWHVDKQRFSFSNAEEFVSVFQQRCEHKACQCNKSYRLPEIEHALVVYEFKNIKEVQESSSFNVTK